ncbi:MAG TPA: hypothetical protein VIJ04_13495, partial [Xanthobacteraceae bacterium]
MSEQEGRERIREQRRADRRAATAFFEACKSGDADLLYKAADLLSNESVTGWTIAVRKIAREVSQVGPDVQSAFLSVWIQTQVLPLKVGDHGALCTAARVLMPPYRGPSVRLYRGASDSERRRRIYGISWTSDIKTAEKFAEECSQFDEGSVLLETIAPPEAIVCDIG